MKPNNRHLSIEIIVVICGIACVLGVFFTTVGATAGAGSNDAPQSMQPSPVAPAASQTYEGVVTDSKCGAKHNPAIPESAADCTRACVHSGEKFALVDGDKIYVLEGEPEILKRSAGDRVTISGWLKGGTLTVSSVRESTP